MATKDAKFVAQLKRSNSKIRADRANRIGESVADAQEKLIMDIKAEIRNKYNRLDNLIDLSADNRTTSMNVVSDDFSADAFVKEINKLKVEIQLAEVKLKIAQETKDEWFAA